MTEIVRKLKWGNKYRNLMLVSTILVLAVNALFPILLLGRGYAEEMINNFLKINLFTILFAVFFLYTQWGYFNRINEGKLRPPKTETVLIGLLLILLLLSGVISIYSAIMGITIYLYIVEISIRIFWMALMSCVPFMYPMIIYWEWKNKKTIYLVEKEPRGWRPVALPDRIS